MTEGISSKRAITVVYWVAENITAKGFKTLPEWIQGRLRNRDIYITSSFNYSTFEDEYTVHYRTVLGYKECPIGDYLILDKDNLYSLTPEAFNRIFQIEEEIK